MSEANGIIVINALSARVGGGKTYLKNLLTHLPSRCSKIYIFGYSDLLDVANPNIVLVPTHPRLTNPLIRLIWEYLVFPFWLKRLRADLLFCPGGLVNTRAPRGCKVVTMFRNMLPFDHQALDKADIKTRIKNKLLKSKMLSSMQDADLVIFISSFAREIVERHITLKSAVTIPHGIAKNFMVSNTPLERPAPPIPENYILYVSRFEPYKRHMEVVKAYQSLPASLRQLYPLILVGGTQSASGMSVEAYVKQHDLQENVRMLGDYPYRQLPSLYKYARLTLFMSACENCPNILLEAMGAGSPIICSHYQPMPEFGGDAVTYVNPDEPKLIARAIEHHLSVPIEPTTRVKMGARANDFRWEVTADRTWAALAKVLK